MRRWFSIVRHGDWERVRANGIDQPQLFLCGFAVDAPLQDRKRKLGSTFLNLSDRLHSRSIDAKFHDMSTFLISSPVEASPLVEDCPYVSRALAGSVPKSTGVAGVYTPFLKLAALYTLGLANCFPAWKAIANSMPTIGVLLEGVSFLLMAFSFEVAAPGSHLEDTL